MIPSPTTDARQSEHMSEPAILFVKPGAIKRTDKARLQKAGVIVVETPEPETAKLVRPMAPVEELSHGELLAAAGAAIVKNYGTASAFGFAISRALVARHGKQST